MKKTTLAVVTGLILSAGAHADTIKIGNGDLDLGGNMRIDTQVYQVNDADANYDSGGRLSFSAVYSVEQNDYVVESKVNPILKTDGTFALDDVYLDIRGAGEETFGVKMGRFQATNLSPVQIDIFLDDADLDESAVASPLLGHYKANTYRGRSNDYGQFMAYGNKGIVNYELNVMAGDYNDNGNSSIAIRPVVGLQLTDSLKWTAGIEKSFDGESVDSDAFGFGTNVNFMIGEVSTNLNYAYGTIDTEFGVEENPKLTGLDVDADINTIGLNSAYKGFAVGVYNSTIEANSIDLDVFTVYAGYERKNFLVDSLKIAGGAFYSDAEVKDTDVDAENKGLRLRLQYDF